MKHKLITKADYDKFIAPHIKELQTSSGDIKDRAPVQQYTDQPDMPKSYPLTIDSNGALVLQTPYASLRNGITQITQIGSRSYVRRPDDHSSASARSFDESTHSRKMAVILNACLATLQDNKDGHTLLITILGSFEGLDHLASLIPDEDLPTLENQPSQVWRVKSIKDGIQLLAAAISEDTPETKEIRSNLLLEYCHRHNKSLSKQDKRRYLERLIQVYESQTSSSQFKQRMQELFGTLITHRKAPTANPRERVSTNSHLSTTNPGEQVYASHLSATIKNPILAPKDKISAIKALIIDNTLAPKHKISAIKALIHAYRDASNKESEFNKAVKDFFGEKNLKMLEQKSPAMEKFIKHVRVILKTIGLKTLSHKLSPIRQVYKNLHQKHSTSKSPNL